MNECSICKEKHLTTLKLNNCSHDFCSYCTYSWFKKKNTCPLCRKSFSLDNLSIKLNTNLNVRTRGHEKILKREKFILNFLMYHLKLKVNYIYSRTYACRFFVKLIIDLLLDNISVLSESDNICIDRIILKIVKKYFKQRNIDFIQSLGLDENYKKKYKKLKTLLYHNKIIDNTMANLNVIIV